MEPTFWTSWHCAFWSYLTLTPELLQFLLSKISTVETLLLD